MQTEHVPIDVVQQLPPNTVFGIDGIDGYFVVVSASAVGVLAETYTKTSDGDYVQHDKRVFAPWTALPMIEIHNTRGDRGGNS